MKGTKEDNTVGIIQRAFRYFKIPVMKSSVKEALKSHSAYPAFKSICDSLNEWNIENYPLKYPVDEILDIKAPYIVHFKDGGGQIGFVTKIENDNITYYESYENKRVTDTKKYLERCSGAVILINPDEKSGEPDFRKKWQDDMISKAILPLLCFAFSFFIFLSFFNNFASIEAPGNKIKLTLALTKSAGIILSLLLVLHEFKVHLSLTEKLCHLNKATNCNTVLHDKASKLFGWFGWADAGFIYFSGGLLFLLQNPNVAGFSLLAVLSALSVPYPLFSVYYQGFVLKKWCPMCLGVQLILVIEFILLLPQFSVLSFSFEAISQLLLTFLFISLIYTLFILFTKERLSDELHHHQLLVFKKNTDILNFLLMNQPHYEIPVTENSLVFGDKHAPFKITAFLSLHCSHCAKAFEKIRNILNSGVSVSINIVLLTSDNKMLPTLYNYLYEGKEEDALKLLDQWYNADSSSRTRISEDKCMLEDEDLSGRVNEGNKQLFKDFNVFGTPTFFINGYKLPSQYEIDDMRYFREIFRGKEEVSIKEDATN